MKLHRGPERPRVHRMIERQTVPLQDDTLALIPAKALHEAQIGWNAQRQEQAAARALASGGEARTIMPWPFAPLGGVQ